MSAPLEPEPGAHCPFGACIGHRPCGAYLRRLRSRPAPDAALIGQVTAAADAVFGR